MTWSSQDLKKKTKQKWSGYNWKWDFRLFAHKHTYTNTRWKSFSFLSFLRKLWNVFACFNYDRDFIYRIHSLYGFLYFFWFAPLLFRLLNLCKTFAFDLYCVCYGILFDPMKFIFAYEWLNVNIRNRIQQNKNVHVCHSTLFNKFVFFCFHLTFFIQLFLWIFKRCAPIQLSH